jgi:riboflavin synthase
MFSGIVEKMVPIVSITKRSKSALIRIDLGKLAKGTKIGDSIAVNGVCLTVTKKRKGVVSFDVIDESLRVTNLGELTKGSKVNIERSLSLTDRIGGHLVSGHADGVGRITKIERPANDSVKMWIETTTDLLSSMIPKGSVAVDGISLTLVDVGKNRFSICLIPHTLSTTTLGHKTGGDSVNIEVDAIGKYVRKYLGQINLKDTTLKDSVD